MRISDWSSDVCSSDLVWPAGCGESSHVSQGNYADRWSGDTSCRVVAKTSSVKNTHPERCELALEATVRHIGAPAPARSVLERHLARLSQKQRSRQVTPFGNAPV